MRHGQTHANVSGELDTAHPGVDLTDLGRAQAVAAGKVLSEVPIDAIYVSSRVRTHQTAAPTAEHHGLALTPLEGLEEISAGDVEMRSDHDAVATYIGTVATWLEGDLTHRMPGGETGEEFLARFDAAVGTIVAAGHDTALIVSHGAALRTWVSTRMDPDPDAPPATQPLHNTALLVIDGDFEAGWRLVSWQGHPVGGATPEGLSLEDATAEDPTGDLDSDGDGEIS